MSEDNIIDRRSNEIQSVRTDVEILKRDVSNIQNLLNRLDTAIDKIADATGGISKILAVHESDLDRVTREVEERKRLFEKETELLHVRISEMKDDNSKERKQNHAELMAAIKSLSTETNSELKHLSDRVGHLEKWKWWIMGGSWAIGFAIATLVQMGGIIELLMNK